MSSFTNDFSLVTKNRQEGDFINQRNALSTVKRTRQCQRRKFLHIGPLQLDEIHKQIEEAESDGISESKSPPAKPDDANKENEVKPISKLQDSFDFGFMSLNTPVKKSEPVKNNFATPSLNYRPIGTSKINRNLEFQYVTPNTKIPPKVQCSVKMQPYLRTPITKLCTAPDQHKVESELKPAVQLRPSLDPTFQRIKVNDVEYIILNELGKGGSSEVFHCYNHEMKTHRAIKVVSLANGASATGFINEVKMLKALQQCNRIIKMFDYEIKEEEKILLVVLEVGGTDLSKILKESALNTTHMPLYMLLYYWMEMLYAVKQIHSHGIVHSDLKPANFLKVEGYLKLIDFGIASCIQSDMTSVVKAVPEGSFNYISPEALSNENSTNVNSPSYGKPKYKISYKSDVWSLGCILYQLVYRRTPFQHISQIWVKLSTIVNAEHKIEYPEAPWVPQKIIDTIRECLQRDVKLRPSVDDLILLYENMFRTLS